MAFNSTYIYGTFIICWLLFLALGIGQKQNPHPHGFHEVETDENKHTVISVSAIKNKTVRIQSDWDATSERMIRTV